tara:strand:- start:6 stop:353 length:348 start_codon:yes stop_codon:yes gene_type:complete
MSFNKFVLNAQSSIIDACVKIQNNGSRAIAVEDDELLFGVLSEGDLIRAFIDGARNVSSIREYVNISPSYFEPNTPNIDIKFMQGFVEGITLFPIVDDRKKIIGVKTIFGEFYAN